MSKDLKSSCNIKLGLYKCKTHKILDLWSWGENADLFPIATFNLLNWEGKEIQTKKLILFFFKER
jgi:hypothetical protein